MIFIKGRLMKPTIPAHAAGTAAWKTAYKRAQDMRRRHATAKNANKELVQMQEANGWKRGYVLHGSSEGFWMGWKDAKNGHDRVADMEKPRLVEPYRDL